MDAFYASVELLRRPDLRGEAVVVGGARTMQADARLSDYVGRGVVTTATYEARALGVHSGMGLMRAAQLAPDARLLPADFDEYRRLSREFKSAVRRLTPCVEDRGIDEIYIDITDPMHERMAQGVSARAAAVALGQALKDVVREATGLICSIGITPNKLLSKLASDLDKPNGLTVLMADELEARIWPLPARRVNGIGPKAADKLAGMGIHTIGDLAGGHPGELTSAFGHSYAAWLLRAAHGQDDRAVITEQAPKSISRETTFDRDLHTIRDRNALTDVLNTLCERVAADLVRKGYCASAVGIKIRFEDFRTLTRDVHVAVPTQDAHALRAAARSCLKRVIFDKRLRLLGVKTGALVPKEEGTAIDEEALQSTLPLF